MLCTVISRGTCSCVLPSTPPPAPPISTISWWPQVRYQGRAQLAFHGFERPSVIGAELLLFDDDCFGLMWHGPVQSLSLYVRVRQP